MSLSDIESDLTEISSEDEYVPKKQTPRKKKTKPEYRLTNTLAPPRNTSYPASALYNQMKNGMIDLEPEYQRGVVWPDSKQSYLIDSLFRNYYIPPVIFAVTRTSDGIETRVCIDGKQRLTSILRFMEGKIPLYYGARPFTNYFLLTDKDSHNGDKLWFKQPSGPRKPILPRQYMMQFENKQIPCVEYDTLSDDQEREIFQRVQLGVALTAAERMQALIGPYPELARDVQRKISGEDGFGKYLEWSDGRGRDFQCIASMIYLIDSKPTVKFPSSPILDRWLHDTKNLDESLRKGVMETFDIFLILAKDTKYNAPFQGLKVSPVEFTMSAVLIHRCKLTHTMAQLSTAIKRMRANVRGQHEDIRSNTRVSNTMITFIKNEMKKQKEKADDDISAVEFLKKRKKLKRKRDEITDESKTAKSSKPSSDKSKLPASKGVDTQVAKRSQPLGKSASTTAVPTSSRSRVGSGVTVQSVVAKKEKTSPPKPTPSSSTLPSKKLPVRAQASSSSQASSSRLPLQREKDGSAPKKRARPSSPGGDISQPPSVPNSRPPSVPPLTIKTEPLSKTSLNSAPKVDRLAAIRKAKEDQRQRRQSSISQPPTPITPSQPTLSFVQQPQPQPISQPPLPQPLPSVPHSESPAPSAQPGTGAITLPDGQQVSEQQIKTIVALYSQSHSPPASGTPHNTAAATTDPRLRKIPPDHLTPSISRKPSPKPDEKMDIDPPAPATMPIPTEPSSAIAPSQQDSTTPPVQSDAEQPMTTETQVSANTSGNNVPSAPEPTPMENVQPTVLPSDTDTQLSSNPLSFLRQSSAVSAHISSIQQSTNDGVSFPAAAQPGPVVTRPSTPVQLRSLAGGDTLEQAAPNEARSSPIQAKQEHFSPHAPLSCLPPTTPVLPQRPNISPPTAPRSDIASTLAIPAHTGHPVKRESPIVERYPPPWSPSRNRQRLDSGGLDEYRRCEPSDSPTRDYPEFGGDYRGRGRSGGRWDGRDRDRGYRGQRGSRSPQRYRGRGSSPRRGYGYHPTHPR
ncbi:hypothetical protein QCA50_001074 [Cerrena zonata]|uniref:GmrSD restriction endonucleases N-terminal domain-containing protein n=1 Tax=Cerrena zonata TaxID=2478898 RepID=A0AAW0GZX6_9APHY